jgi:hypothetical protein
MGNLCAVNKKNIIILAKGSAAAEGMGYLPAEASAQAGAPLLLNPTPFDPYPQVSVIMINQ